MSLQESQSLLMERHVAGSDEFIDFIGQVIAEEAPEVKLDMENFKNSLRKVQPSYIRMEADEVNYPLHVILRYNIEKKLYKGDIRITDIPEIWNVDFKNIFGLDVKEHRLGCMQDVHWFEGSFGYFPTYTQGDCYASQLFNTAKKDLVDLPGELRKGNLKPLNEWLKENIHSQGQLYDAPDLIERATGEKPNAKYFLDHLKNRYL
jgi:carboxypeptidase Taq